MIKNKKTKIVATIGPVTQSPEMMEKLVEAGLSVMRLNFSHGDHAEHQQKVDSWKKVAEKTGVPMAILQDLSGPKIRTGEFYQERITLKEGSTFTFTTEKVTGDEKIVSVNYPTLPKELVKGNIVMLDDGKKKLEVIRTTDTEIICKVLVGGETKGRRGLNLPGADLSISSITDKDREDLKFGIKNKVDFIALSFVRKPQDISELRGLLDAAKSSARIIAKIETKQAIDNIDQIIDLADGVMVARGDLAIEVPAELVPRYQKMIIKKCNEAGKPVITATQMLESMIHSPVPTRAEVSDVANAIYDGTDAIMLSEETTLGEFPLEAVSLMTRVALEVEKEFPERKIAKKNGKGFVGTTDSVTSSVVTTAHEIGAKLIFALTESGFSARMLSRYKAEPLVLALTPNEVTFRQLALSFGVHPVLIPRLKTLDNAFKTIRSYAIKNKLVQKGDKVVIASGAPFNKKTLNTNMLMIEKI